MANLHFSSGRSGVFEIGLPLLDEARAHASEHAGQFFEVNSIADILAVLDSLESGSVNAMDFHTHGSGGTIWVGEELSMWTRFRNRGYERLFAPDARIEFHGCNVAEEINGELFLVQCALMFLRQNGGVVVGHRGFALATRAWGLDTTTPVYLGGTVIASVRDGSVTLENAEYLLPDRLRARVDLLLACLERLNYMDNRNTMRRDQIMGFKNMVTSIERELRGKPSYETIYRSYHNLKGIDDIIYADRILSMNRCFRRPI